LHEIKKKIVSFAKFSPKKSDQNRIEFQNIKIKAKNTYVIVIETTGK